MGPTVSEENVATTFDQRVYLWSKL